MLIHHSQLGVTFTNSDQCTVRTGRWLDPYLGKVITMASDLDVDHVIPLAYAHVNGAAAWSRTKKQTFAMDEANLLLVDDGENVPRENAFVGILTYMLLAAVILLTNPS
jgi:hypothetical protein